MTQNHSADVLASARRIVVKVGSSLVTNEGRGLDEAAIGEWCRQLALLSRGDEAAGVGGPREVIHPGDTVVFDAGERHWHGATADTGMSHIAITESVDGAMVTWLEPVSDDAYRG